jgi:hypothetical protein
MKSFQRGSTMKNFRRPVRMTLLIFTLMVFACVTINIYFPAEKVESVAGEIVDEIRGQKPINEKALRMKRATSSINPFLLFLRP